MRKVALLFGVVVVVSVAAKIVLTPACWPEGVLRSWLARRLPQGTPESEVNAFLDARGFHTIWRPGQDSLNRAVGLKFSEGSHTIEAIIGVYRQPLTLFVFETSTEAFFRFDDGHRLVDIQLRKDTDAL